MLAGGTVLGVELFDGGIVDGGMVDGIETADGTIEALVRGGGPAGVGTAEAVEGGAMP